VVQTLRRVDVVSQECFYRQLSDKEQQLADRGQFDFDHPSAFDEKLMIQTIHNLKEGKSVTLPEYDYVKNRGNWEKTKVINPADVILVEGILMFYFKAVRDAFSMKLFVDTDADTRLSRRVTRDMNERGRPLDTILAQYINFVKPAFEEFCLPTKKYADVIIPRGADNTVAIDLIVQHIQDLLKPSSRVDLSSTPNLSLESRNDSMSSFKSLSLVEFPYMSAH
jgi:uridine kinase